MSRFVTWHAKMNFGN